MDFKYPYTDFHELNLDWFLAEFKKLTETWLQIQQDWSDEQQAFQDLKDYVDDYFANLDLYQEVRDILWSPEMQGNIQIILSNLTTNMLPGVVADQITAVVASQLSTVVALQLPAVVVDKLPAALPAAVAGEAAAWLADHVDPDTGYVIDDTLSIALAAADAKATGDAIHSVEDVFVYNGASTKIVFVPETACDTSGSTLPSQTARVNQRSVILDCNEGDTFYIHVTGYTSYNGWAFYDVNGDVLIKSGSGAINKIIVAPAGAKKLVINDANTGYDSYIGESLITSIDSNHSAFLALNGLSEIPFHYMQAVNTYVVTYADTPFFNKDWKYANIACNEGDVFTINGTGSTPPRLWAFFDANDDRIDSSAANASLLNGVIYAPAGAKRLVLNVNIASGDPKSYYGAMTSSDIPYYYKDYIANKALEINSMEDESGIDGDTFVFITDYHVQSNTRHSARLIKYLMENTGIRFVVFGGDTQNFEASKQLGIEKMMEYVSDYGNLDIYNIIGNHEFNTHYGSQYAVTYATIINMLTKKREKDAIEVTSTGDYYIDNTAQKIRYYFLGCDENIDIPAATIHWALESFEHLPDGYSVIVFSHATFNASTTYPGKIFPWDTVKNIGFGMDAVNDRITYTFDGVTYDYRNLANVECVAIIGGHSHFDADNRMAAVIGTNPNVLITATTTDAYAKQLSVTGVLDRVPFTTSEQAFDVIHFDRANRKLYFKRIGAGSDRTFTY